MRILSRLVAVFLALAGLAVLSSSGAEAQATRTWVSGVGDDANPCSRTAPCKTFAGAISKTAANGEISVLDPGGFGAVTITKNISIVADGNEGGILAAGTNGIIISNNTTPPKVFLKGLILEGAGTGLSGIRILSGANVVIEDCVIRGFRGSVTGAGIEVLSSQQARVHVTDTTISENTHGVSVKTTGDPPTSTVVLDNVSLSFNATADIKADGTKARVQIHDSGVVFGAGIVVANGGLVTSFGTNQIMVGAPTGTVPLK